MTPQEYNELFSKLNGVPLNAKWAPEGQMAYLKGLLAIQARNGTNAYRDPYKYATAPAVPINPLAPALEPLTPNTTFSLQRALDSARATVKAIEDLIARGI